MSRIAALWCGLLVAGSLAADEVPVRRDLHGDPLPPGAVARLGTVRFTHADAVPCVAFSPDGRSLIASGADGLVIVWDAVTGKRRRELAGHAEEVRALAVTPDGRTLVTTGLDRTVRIWDLASGKEIAQFDTQPDCLEDIALSPDGRTVAVACRDHTVGLGTLGSTDAMKRLTGHTSSVSCVAFSPDGKTLASGAADHTLRLWDSNGKERLVLNGHSASVDGVAFAPDGKTLASTGADGTVRLWDPSTGKETRKIETGQGRLWSVAFGPGGRTLAAAGDGLPTSLGLRSRTLVLWDVATGKEVRVYPGHGPAPSTYKADQFRTHFHGASRVVFAPDGKVLASGGADGRVRLWDEGAPRERGPGLGHRDTVTAVVLLPDRKTAVSASIDGTLRWWDVKTGRERERIDPGHGPVLSLALSGDGTLLASSGADRAVRLWDATSGRRRGEVEAPAGPAHCALSSDGALLAAGCSDGEDCVIPIWDLKTRREQRRLRAEGVRLLSLAFRPGTAELAAVARYEVVRRWDAATGKELSPLDDDYGDAAVLAYAADGRLAAGFRGGRSVVLWDAAAKKQAQFEDEALSTYSLAVSPDGQSLAGGHEGAVVRLWETATGKTRRVLRGARGPVRALAYSPDGRLLAATADHTVLVWDCYDPPQGPLKDASVSRLQELWRDLGSDDVGQGHDAVCALVSAPDRAVPFLALRLTPLPRWDADRIRRAIADLDAHSFQVREKAMDDLTHLGRLAEEHLREALKKGPPLEARKRIEELLDRIAASGASSDWLRMGRAVEALEQIGGEGARRLLDRLAAGADAAPTRHARAALDRLKARMR